MRRLSSLLCFLFLVISYAPLHAQTIDTAIVGMVTDASGAVIPGAPGTVQGTGTFGVVTTTNSDNRELQLALKYIF